MTSISAPPGKSKVRPFFGIPLLLSSSMLVGASGKPGFLFVFLSLSFKTSNSWLPILGFDGFGVASVYRLSTRAALSLSLAVNGALLPLVCLISEETEPLDGSTDLEVSLPALSESVEEESRAVIALSSVSQLDIITTNLLLFEISDLLKGQNFDEITLAEDLRTGLHLV